MKVGTHEKSYRNFVGNPIYVSVPGLIDPRVIVFQIVTLINNRDFIINFDISKYGISSIV